MAAIWPAAFSHVTTNDNVLVELSLGTTNKLRNSSSSKSEGTFYPNPRCTPHFIVSTNDTVKVCWLEAYKPVFDCVLGEHNVNEPRKTQNQRGWFPGRQKRLNHWEKPQLSLIIFLVWQSRKFRRVGFVCFDMDSFCASKVHIVSLFFFAHSFFSYGTGKIRGGHYLFLKIFQIFAFVFAGKTWNTVKKEAVNERSVIYKSFPMGSVFLMKASPKKEIFCFYLFIIRAQKVILDAHLWVPFLHTRSVAKEHTTCAKV